MRGDHAVFESRVVDIGDVPVLLEAGDEDRAQAMSRLLGALPVSPGPAGIAIRYLVDAPTLPRREPDHAFDGYRIWFHDDEVHLAHRTGAQARVSESRAWIGGGDDHPVAAFRASFLPVVTHLLALQDRFVLHAGAVVGGTGAYVVFGESGAGKSTLALAALESGWPLLSDDMVVLRHAGPEVHVAGIPRPVAVPLDLRPTSVALTGRAGRARVALSPTCLQPGWCTVDGVIAVGHGSSPEGALRPLDGRRALQTALRAYASTLNPPLLRRFFPAAAMLARLPAWELQHGSDTTSRLGAAARMLANVQLPTASLTSHARAAASRGRPI